MNPKPRPNHRRYIETLRRMSPSDRLRKALELSEFSRDLFVSGLRAANPQLDERQFAELLRKGLLKCHNRNY